MRQAKNCFDISPSESGIEQVFDVIFRYRYHCTIHSFCKFTEKAREEFCYDNIWFNPKFIGERKALYDNFHQSHIIVNVPVCNKCLEKSAEIFAALLKQCAFK